MNRRTFLKAILCASLAPGAAFAKSFTGERFDYTSAAHVYVTVRGEPIKNCLEVLRKTIKKLAPKRHWGRFFWRLCDYNRAIEVIYFPKRLGNPLCPKLMTNEP